MTNEDVPQLHDPAEFSGYEAVADMSDMDPEPDPESEPEAAPQPTSFPRIVEVEEKQVVRHNLRTGETLTIPLESSKARVVATDTQAPPSHDRLVGHTVVRPEGSGISQRTLSRRRRKAARPPYLRSWERR